MSINLNKKIIVCCDGTWQDADSGYTKPSLIPYRPYGILQIPSNVVRISRALRRQDFRGKPQIIYYQTGVGSGSTFLDKLTGGLLGTGISDNIREAYSFITTNYVAGDEIILIGFSRGAYTARAIAGLINDIGLLTRRGMAVFYAVFKDIQNSHSRHYNDIFPNNPFPDKPRRGRHFVEQYKRRLVENGLTRIRDPNGEVIDILAVAVWDTVGSLGIPSLGLMQKLGVPHATREMKFFDTSLGNHVRHAFQLLALDEHRRPFSPAVWERRDDKSTTDLRQVWIPGAHSNCGGGYDDQELANVSLAWMMDQLASIGVEFLDRTINRIFEENRQYYENLPRQATALFSNKPTTEWAIPEIYEKHKPVRPWGLGKIYESETGIYRAAGRITRTPGLYRRTDPDTGLLTDEFMTNTNERIHSCVRVRLDLGGLDTDDKGLYQCQALLHDDMWELRQVRIKVFDPIRRDANWGTPDPQSPIDPPDSDLRWVWKYVGPRSSAPPVRTMIEENLGPYERQLLLMNTGKDERKSHRRRRRRRKSPEY